MSGVVRRSIVIPSDAAEVWAALTDRDRLRLWFGAEIEIDPRADGRVHAEWPDGARSVGSVERADPPTRLVFRWRRIQGVGFASRVGAATRVSFELGDADGGTTVSVTEEPVELASVVATS